VRNRISHLLLFGAAGALVVYLVPAPAGGQPSSLPPSNDAVARLEQRLERGEASLEYRPGLGYLPSLLKLLDINADSQVLVFSKTSFQQALISPKNPRAIYFNDDVFVGAVPGGQVFEVSALDPVRGVVFYTLGMQQSQKPHLERTSGVCEQCHGPVSVLVPGLMVTSVIPDSEGTPFFTGAFFNITDHRTPIDQRWGGWYVTGASEPHLGNAIAPDPKHPTELETKGTQNLTSLIGKFDTSKYLEPTSDIVALMTLEHQTRIINLITSISAQARSLAEKGKFDAATTVRLDSAVEDIVSALLFADEAELHRPVKGVSSFTQTFPQRGPRDKRGRSLRDFDLHKRMFHYPLSYMIYDGIFDTMQDNVRTRVYRRLYDVLSGQDSTPKYARLSREDRTAILEILRDTKQNLPDYFN
jgi:hypothetical protein